MTKPLFDFNVWQADPANETQHTRSRISAYQGVDGMGRHRVLEAVKCRSGLALSIQASDGLYCEPRNSNFQFYSAVEVGFPSQVVAVLMPYVDDSDKPTDTVYGYVPVEVVNDVVNAHNGNLDVLQKWFRDERSSVRADALKLMTYFGIHVSPAELKPFLIDPERDVREAAIKNMNSNRRV